MTLSVDPFSDWDAAYVLGALSPKDRHEYEAHLAGCAQCGAAVTELAAVPGLLAKVPEREVTDAAPEMPSLLPRLVLAARRRRFRDRALAVGAALAAAAVAAVLAIVIPLAWAPDAPTTADVTLSQVVDSPLQAEVRLVSLDWGTRIEMTCRYAAAPSARTGSAQYPAAPRDYALYVTDRDGNARQVASWAAAPGSTVEASGATSLPVAAIRSIDVRSLASGRVLLRGAIGD